MASGSWSLELLQLPSARQLVRKTSLSLLRSVRNFFGLPHSTRASLSLEQLFTSMLSDTMLMVLLMGLKTWSCTDEAGQDIFSVTNRAFHINLLMSLTVPGKGNCSRCTSELPNAFVGHFIAVA